MELGARPTAARMPGLRARLGSPPIDVPGSAGRAKTSPLRAPSRSVLGAFRGTWSHPPCVGVSVLTPGAAFTGPAVGGGLLAKAASSPRGLSRTPSSPGLHSGAHRLPDAAGARAGHRSCYLRRQVDEAGLGSGFVSSQNEAAQIPGVGLAGARRPEGLGQELPGLDACPHAGRRGCGL